MKQDDFKLKLTFCSLSQYIKMYTWASAAGDREGRIPLDFHTWYW